MTPEQKAILTALGVAQDQLRSAQALRDEMISTAMALGVGIADIRKVMGIEEAEDG